MKNNSHHPLLNEKKQGTEMYVSYNMYTKLCTGIAVSYQWIRKHTGVYQNDTRVKSEW